MEKYSMLLMGALSRLVVSLEIAFQSKYTPVSKIHNLQKKRFTRKFL